MKKTILLFALIAFCFQTIAQVGINSDNSAPDPSAMLDVKSPAKGLLPPRVNLTATNVAGPVSSPAIGLQVYNTSTAGTSPYNVAPGIYSWDGTQWIPVIAPKGVNVGDMQYWNGVQWITVPIGVPGQILQILPTGIPAWNGSAYAAITTNAATNITASTAISGGTISSDGGSAITAKGICYNTSPNPTIANMKVTGGTGTGSFSSSMWGLLAGTTYYVRAYATNSAGTAYGNEISFTTIANATIPTVTTTAVSNITAVSAISGGTVNSAGGATVTARGVCWSTSPNPTTANSKTSNGTGTGGFASTMSSLASNTIYYIRAYATNSAGTGYGNELTFTTLCANPVAASVSITTSANPVCAGSSVTLTATPTNGGASPVYQWKVNGANVGTNSVSYTFTPVNNDVVTCVMTSNLACVTGNPATSNAITLTVNPLITPSVSIEASTNPVCDGSIVSISATPTNGGIVPVYQWKLNDNNAGTNNSVFNYYPANGDSVYCILTSSHPCAAGPVASNGIIITVNPMLALGVTIAASANNVCAGTEVTFTSTTTNSGTFSTYQWKNGGVAISGATNATYNYVPANNDIITCVFTSNPPCTLSGPVTSNAVTVTVNPVAPASVTIVASGNPANTGTSVTFTATPVNGGSTPVFQWKVNGVNAGTNAPTFSYVPANNDSILCVLTSNLACVSGNPATSNKVVMTVNAMGLPCPGTPTVSYGGQTYNTVKIGEQCWLKENLNIGTRIDGEQEQTNNGIIEKYCYNDLESNCVVYGGLYQWSEMMNYLSSSNSIPSNRQGICPTGWHLPSDAEWCQMENYLDVTLDCSSSGWLGFDGGGKMKDSTTNHWLYPNVGANNVSGFTALPSGRRVSSGGFDEISTGALFWSAKEDVYQGLAYNHSQIGRNFHDRTNGFSVRCIKDTCSNYSSTGVSITPSANPACLGTSITFTATPTNGGTSPFYQWKVNGVFVGANSPTYTFTPANGDSIRCIMTSSVSCATNPTTSNIITMTVNPILPVSVSINASSNPFIIGSSVTFTATEVNGSTSPVYQWVVNGVVISGAMNATYVYVPSNGDVVNCVMTSNAGCITGNPATSNQIVMTVSPGVPCPGVPTITYGGQIYNTIQIADQCWFRENLNVGAMVTDAFGQSNNGTIEKYCYNADSTYCSVYGGLYRWDEMMNYTSSSNTNPSNRQGICPTGWHVPSDAEWCQLEAILDPYINCLYTGFRGYDGGGKMKVAGLTHWSNPNTGANNSSGFSVLPGGYNYYGGQYMSLSFSACFWTATENQNSSSRYWTRYFNHTEARVEKYDYDYAYGMSVRCLKNCDLPLLPAQGSHTPTQTQIIWNWNSVSGALGYKWSITNDYALATDLGTATTKTETGLTPNTSYTRYLWAYNSCGASPVTTLASQTTTFAIGQSYGGGIIFYIYQPGDDGYVAGETHGLISRTSDQASFIQWGCYGVPIGTSDNIGSGQANTTAIINGCSTSEIAARICDNLVYDGYSDWFLPSLNELIQMYQQRIIIGGFTTTTYMSSTESSMYGAYRFNFAGTGTTESKVKNNGDSVRAVRAF